MSKHSLSVPGISCNHCKESIESAVGALTGVRTVSVDVDAKRVDVELDETTTALATIVSAIQAVGFEVTPS